MWIRTLSHHNNKNPSNSRWNKYTQKDLLELVFPVHILIPFVSLLCYPCVFICLLLTKGFMLPSLSFSATEYIRLPWTMLNSLVKGGLSPDLYPQFFPPLFFSLHVWLTSTGPSDLSWDSARFQEVFPDYQILVSGPS